MYTYYINHKSTALEVYYQFMGDIQEYTFNILHMSRKHNIEEELTMKLF